MSDVETTRQLVVSIISFLRDQLQDRDDMSMEDRDSLQIAVECLELVYGLDAHYASNRRPLLDMFAQTVNPVSVKDKLLAETFKTSGNEKMNRSEFEEAFQDYTSAINLDKWNAVYYCNRAGARIELEAFPEAIVDCRQAIALNPDYAKAFGRMGHAYVGLNRPREAINCFRKAVELDPENERYRNNLRIASEEATQPSDLFQGFIAGFITSLLQDRNGEEFPFTLPSPPSSNNSNGAEFGTPTDTVNDLQQSPDANSTSGSPRRGFRILIAFPSSAEEENAVNDNDLTNQGIQDTQSQEHLNNNDDQNEDDVERSNDVGIENDKKETQNNENKTQE